MPFTFAHPAFALPIQFMRPGWFSVTGLVMGSMAPDFEYFLALEPHRTIGHSFLGLVVQALPLSVLFAYLFHAYVKQPFVLHLPSAYGLRGRVYSLLGTRRRSRGRLQDGIIFLMSVSAGFLSHIAVDAFTHEGGYMVQHLTMLQAVVISDLPAYKLVQHSLSLIGMAAIAGTIGSALYRADPKPQSVPVITPEEKWLYWGLGMLAAVAVTGAKLLLTAGSNSLGTLVVAPITGFCVGILAASLLWRRNRHRNRAAG